MVRKVFQLQQGEKNVSSLGKTGAQRPLAEHPRVQRLLRLAEERPNGQLRYVVDESTRTVLVYGLVSGARIDAIPESHWDQEVD